MLRWTLLLLISMCLCFLGNTKKSGIAGSWIIHIQKFNGCCQICPPKKSVSICAPTWMKFPGGAGYYIIFYFCKSEREKSHCFILCFPDFWGSWMSIISQCGLFRLYFSSSQLSVHHSWTCGSPSYGKILSYYIGYKFFSICSLFSHLLYGILHFEK